MEFRQKTASIGARRVIVEMLLLAANALFTGVAVSVTAVLFVAWLATLG